MIISDRIAKVICNENSLRFGMRRNTDECKYFRCDLDIFFLNKSEVTHHLHSIIQLFIRLNCTFTGFSIIKLLLYDQYLAFVLDFSFCKVID